MKNQVGRKAGPVVREMEIGLFAPGVLTPVLSGSLFVLDHLKGGNSHAVSGALRDQQGAEYDIVGRLDGMSFVAKQKAIGRPSKDMRNVAAYMALEWFKSGQKPAPQARRELLAYWQERWPGMPDESTRDALIRKGKAAFLDILRTPGAMVKHVSHGGEDGAVIALPPGCIQHRTGECVAGSGEGWLWRYGDEESRFCSFSFEAPLRG